MGVYSPVPGISLSDHAKMVAILQRTANTLADDKIDFRGVLYGGFILTADGPKVLEYNTRFGDPETQVLLPRLETDLAEVLLATANGELDTLGDLSWSDDVVVSVVMASGGYPGDYETGKPITGIADAEACPGVVVYHAGTKLAEDGTRADGGRSRAQRHRVRRRLQGCDREGVRGGRSNQVRWSVLPSRHRARALSASQPARSHSRAHKERTQEHACRETALVGHAPREQRIPDARTIRTR